MATWQNCSHEERLRLVAENLSYFPFKGVKFYDVGSLGANPIAFEFCNRLFEEILCKNYPDATVIGALDARGFLFAPYLVSQNRKLSMIRKLGKMPNAVTSGAYETEYGHRDGVAVQRHVVKPGDKVVLIDDLVATGGTLAAATEAVKAVGAEVIGCITLVELDAFAERRAKVIPGDVPRSAVFATEAELLKHGSKAAPLPDNYVDDGTAFESEGAMPKV